MAESCVEKEMVAFCGVEAWIIMEFSAWNFVAIFSRTDWMGC